MLMKVLRFLFFLILASWLYLNRPLGASASGLSDFVDTSKIYQMVFQGKRKEAADSLAKFLTLRQSFYNVGFAELWFEAAIFRALSDSMPFSVAEGFYMNYTKYRTNQPETPVILANQLLYNSLFLAYSGLHNQAADCLLASISARPAEGRMNQLLLAESYGSLARMYKKTGDLFESSLNFERAISLNRKINRQAILAESLFYLSNVLSELDISNKKAESALLESLSIYTDLGKNQEKAQVLSELGVLFSRRNDFPGARNWFMKSLAEKKKIPHLKSEEFIAVYSGIGNCYQSIKNTDSARFYFLKAIEWAKKASIDAQASYQSMLGLAKCYVNLGANYGRSDDYSAAIEYFQRALNCLDPGCTLVDMATNPNLKKVTREFAEFTSYKAHAYHRRFGQSKNPEDLVNGLKTFMVALEMVDTLRFMFSFDSKPYLSSETKIHYFNALDMALDLYKVTGIKKYLEQAFQFSERNKSAILNEFLRINKARESIGLVAPWIIKEDSIKQLISKSESQRILLETGRNSGDSSLLAIQKNLFELNDELKSIGIVAKRNNPEYFNMVYSNQGYTTGQIQRLMKKGEAMVDYTVVRNNRLKEDYMVVMVLTTDTLFSYEDTLSNKFREDIDAFRASITPFVDAKNFIEFSRLSHQMYRYFFEPIEKFRGISKLIILPDEELGFLPFEAFVSDTIKIRGSDFRKLHYLNRKYQISYISSHEQFYQFRSNPLKKLRLTVYGFAPFANAGLDSLNLLPLGNSGKENKFISKYFKTRFFENQSAGEQTLRRAFQKESVISLSTHGIVNLKEPMRSRLLLNPSEPDGSLYLFEMMSLKVKSSLIILNACNTGTGKLQVGEGIMSMARGFQFAGVPTLITTLWPIDDQSSSRVMEYFFQYLHNGMEQRDALTKARNSYIDKANKATGAPYFWAGQILIGDPGIISIRRNTSLWVLLISLILTGLVTTSIIVYYKKVR
jgi:CHAT domain-containing protein